TEIDIEPTVVEGRSDSREALEGRRFESRNIGTIEEWILHWSSGVVKEHQGAGPRLQRYRWMGSITSRRTSPSAGWPSGSRAARRGGIPTAERGAQVLDVDELDLLLDRDHAIDLALRLLAVHDILQCLFDVGEIPDRISGVGRASLLHKFLRAAGARALAVPTP